MGHYFLDTQNCGQKVLTHFIIHILCVQEVDIQFFKVKYKIKGVTTSWTYSCNLPHKMGL